MIENKEGQIASPIIDPYEDEIELIDYLLVIWKWKYLIITGTLAFALTAAIISFVTWKQQPAMYRTNIVLKPGVLKFDDNGKPIFIASPQKVKTLIENDSKHKILDYIKSSNSKNMSTSLDFQIDDISKGSETINVSMVSALGDEDITKLNYLIKALKAEFNDKIKLIQEGYDKKIESKKNNIADFQTEIEIVKKHFLAQIEQEKTLLAELKEKDMIERKKYESNIERKKTLLAELKENKMVERKKYEFKIEQKKIEFDQLLFEEKKIKNKIENYEQKLSKLESKIKLLNESNDISQSREYFLNKLSLDNDYRNTSQRYFELNENAKYNLFGIQKKITELSKEIKNLEKAQENNEANPILQPALYKIQKDIVNVSKEIEKFEKAKESNEADPILQANLYKIQKNIIKVTKGIEKLGKRKNNIQSDIIYGMRFLNIQKGIATNSKEIEDLEMDKQNIQSIQILQPPTAVQLPLEKAKTKRNIILTSFVGLFLMMFLAFFFEYISKLEKRKTR